MKYFAFLIFVLFNQILLQENIDGYESPCESIETVEKFEDCLDRSCEYIEEICCYLESKTNNTNRKECVDFNFYDYMRDDLKNNAINKIKNGVYWETYNYTYDEIISLRCNSKNLCPHIFLLFMILYIFLYF